MAKGNTGILVGAGIAAGIGAAVWYFARKDGEEGAAPTTTSYGSGAPEITPAGVVPKSATPSTDAMDRMREMMNRGRAAGPAKPTPPTAQEQKTLAAAFQHWKEIAQSPHGEVSGAMKKTAIKKMQALQQTATEWSNWHGISVPGVPPIQAQW